MCVCVCVCVCVVEDVPEVPEEKMADGLALQGSAQKEVSQCAVQVGLKLEHLYQLQQIHVELVITA